MDLTRLETEQQNSRTMNLDEMSTLEIVRAMNKEDHYVPEAISQKLPVIANCIDVIARQFKKVADSSILEPVLADDWAFSMRLNVYRHSVLTQRWFKD